MHKCYSLIQKHVLSFFPQNALLLLLQSWFLFAIGVNLNFYACKIRIKLQFQLFNLPNPCQLIFPSSKKCMPWWNWYHEEGLLRMEQLHVILAQVVRREWLAGQWMHHIKSFSIFLPTGSWTGMDCLQESTILVVWIPCTSF